MRNPDEQVVALECLKLAVDRNFGDPVEDAARFLAFVLGKDADGETLQAVRELVR